MRVDKNSLWRAGAAACLAGKSVTEGLADLGVSRYDYDERQEFATGWLDMGKHLILCRMTKPGVLALSTPPGIDPQAIANALNGVTAPQPEPVTQDTIPWAAMDERFRWAARDERGSAFAYERKPATRSDDWHSGEWQRIDNTFSGYIPGTCDWRYSLQARPEGV